METKVLDIGVQELALLKAYLDSILANSLKGLSQRRECVLKLDGFEKDIILVGLNRCVHHAFKDTMHDRLKELGTGLEVHWYLAVLEFAKRCGECCDVSTPFSEIDLPIPMSEIQGSQEIEAVKP